MRQAIFLIGILLLGIIPFVNGVSFSANKTLIWNDAPTVYTGNFITNGPAYSHCSNSASCAVAETFTFNSTLGYAFMGLDSVTVQLSSSAPLPTGNLQAQLFGDPLSGTSPLATGSSLAINSVSGSITPYTFTFSTPVITNGLNYWVVIASLNTTNYGAGSITEWGEGTGNHNQKFYRNGVWGVVGGGIAEESLAVYADNPLPDPSITGYGLALGLAMVAPGVGVLLFVTTGEGGHKDRLKGLLMAVSVIAISIGAVLMFSSFFK